MKPGDRLRVRRGQDTPYFAVGSRCTCLSIQNGYIAVRWDQDAVDMHGRQVTDDGMGWFASRFEREYNSLGNIAMPFSLEEIHGYDTQGNSLT
jgi:hypothetical protein